ncbi:NitT/TauT family transport system substrate-binding protein [Nitrobacteraceae bacterium AZCC 2146]
MKSQRFLKFSVLAFAAQFLLSLSLTPLFAADKVIIRMDWAPSGVHAPFHLALAKGWFRDAGIDVELQDGKGSINTLQLLATGEADIGEVTTGIVPIARESGMRVKAVLGLARRSALSVLVPQGSSMRAAEDLRGKRIVLFAASPWTPFVDTFLKSAGMKRSDVQMVMVDPAALLPTYSSKQVDAFMTLGPGAAHVLKSRPSRAIDADQYGVIFPDHGLVVNEDFIKSRGPVLKKVLEIAVKAWKYVLDGHEDEAMEAILANRPNHNLDRDVLRAHWDLYKAYLDTPNTTGKPFGWQSDKDWEAANKTLVGAGVIKSGKQISDFYTNDFVPDASY